MKKALLSIGLGVPVLGVIAWSFVLTLDLIGRPFPGFVTFPNLLVSPLNLPWWPAPRDGVLYPWILESLDSTPLRSADGLENILASVPPGEVHIFTFRNGHDREIKGLPVMTFGTADLLVLCGPLFLAGLIITAMGMFTGLAVPRTPTSLALFFSCLALGGWMGTMPDWIISHRIPLSLLFFVSMTTASAVSYPFLIPYPWAGLRGRYWFIAPFSLSVGVVMWALFLTSLSDPDRYVAIDSINAGLLVLCWALYGVRLVGAARSSRGADWKVARIAILGGVVPFGFVMVPFVIFLYFFHAPYSLLAFTMPLGILLPASMAWGLWKMSPR